MTSTLAGYADPTQTPANRRQIPAGTTVLFALLVTTLVVTSSIIFMSLWAIASPDGHRMAAVMNSCKVGLRGSASNADGRVAGLVATSRRYSQCVEPMQREQVSYALYGVIVLFGLAVLIYLVYPRWYIYRRKLTPILPEDSPELAGYLAELVRQAELTQPPEFMLAPYASTFGGLVFGRFRQRFVQLDAGLVTGFATDQPKFRAVVMHELAHLRNRDVDIAYLTMSFWWSFVAVALVPMTVVTIHPWLFITPLHWHAPSIENPVSLALSVGLLTGLGYLTRNAILRVREIYADAGAADSDGPGTPLRAVVNGLKPPVGWRALSGTHPAPRRRLQAIDNPAATLTPKLWELFVAGLATAMIAVNLRYILSQTFPTSTTLSFVVTGMICVPGLVGPVIVVIWRTGASAPSERLPLRVILPKPAVLAAGFVAGEQLAWLSIYTQWVDLASGGIWRPVVAAVLLLAGGAVLAVWTASVAHHTLARDAPTPKWALPAVVMAGIVTFAPWFGDWFANHDSLLINTLVFADEVPPHAPGWLVNLAQWVEVTYAPLLYLIDNSLTLPGLVLLWLVPVWITARARRSQIPVHRPPYRIANALTFGLTGALAFALASIAITFAVNTALPVTFRDVRISYELYDTYIAFAVLAQAAVATAIAATAQRHRPILIPIATLTTGILAEAIMTLGLFPLNRYLNISGQRDTALFKMPDIGFTTNTLQTILTEGAIIAVPAALLGAMIQQLLKRLRTPHKQQPPPEQDQATGPIPTIILAMLITVVLTAAITEAPQAYSLWIT